MWNRQNQEIEQTYDDGMDNEEEKTGDQDQQLQEVVGQPRAQEGCQYLEQKQYQSYDSQNYNQLKNYHEGQRDQYENQRKQSKKECVQEKQHDEKHKVFLYGGHNNDNLFDHPHNQEKHIHPNGKTTKLPLLEYNKQYDII